MEEKSQKITRKQQAEETKKKLIKVSLELIEEYGFDKVKISDICKKAGVSTGAFYHHIKGKEGIVIEGYSQCDEYFRNEVIPRFKERDDIGVISEYICEQMKYAQNLGIDMCTQIYKVQLTIGTEFFLSDKRGLPYGLIKILKHLQDTGVLNREKKAEELSKEILVISRGILYNWCQMQGEYDLQEFATTIIDNYIKAYTL